jgi:hypothetical protein
MKTAVTLMLIQGCLGAFDTVWFHEFKLRLPQASTARKELRLHACRDFIYAVVFGSLAWATYHGFYAWILCGLLLAEIIITLQDFVEEDRSRRVPAGERVMHALMGMVYGAILTSLWPQIAAWSELPAGIAPARYGAMSWILTALAIGVLISGLRDLVAATRGSGQRAPMKAQGV